MKVHLITRPDIVFSPEEVERWLERGAILVGDELVPCLRGASGGGARDANKIKAQQMGVAGENFTGATAASQNANAAWSPLLQNLLGITSGDTARMTSAAGPQLAANTAALKSTQAQLSNAPRGPDSFLMQLAQMNKGMSDAQTMGNAVNSAWSGLGQLGGQYSNWALGQTSAGNQANNAALNANQQAAELSPWRAVLSTVGQIAGTALGGPLGGALSGKISGGANPTSQTSGPSQGTYKPPGYYDL